MYAPKQAGWSSTDREHWHQPGSARTGTLPAPSRKPPLILLTLPDGISLEKQEPHRNFPLTAAIALGVPPALQKHSVQTLAPELKGSAASNTPRYQRLVFSAPCAHLFRVLFGFNREAITEAGPDFPKGVQRFEGVMRCSKCHSQTVRHNLRNETCQQPEGPELMLLPGSASSMMTGRSLQSGHDMHCGALAPVE